MERSQVVEWVKAVDARLAGEPFLGLPPALSPALHLPHGLGCCLLTWASEGPSASSARVVNLRHSGRVCVCVHV